MLDAGPGEPTACEAMRRSGAELLARAQAAGDVRGGVDIDDLVRMVQAIGLAAEESADPDTAEPPVRLRARRRPRALIQSSIPSRRPTLLRLDLALPSGFRGVTSTGFAGSGR